LNFVIIEKKFEVPSVLGFVPRYYHYFRFLVVKVYFVVSGLFAVIFIIIIIIIINIFEADRRDKADRRRSAYERTEEPDIPAADFNQNWNLTTPSASP